MDNEAREQILNHVQVVMAPMLSELFTATRMLVNANQTQAAPLSDTQPFGVPDEDPQIDAPSADDLVPDEELAILPVSEDVPPPPPPETPEEIAGVFDVPTSSAERPLPLPEAAESLGEGAVFDPLDPSVQGIVLDPGDNVPLPPEPDVELADQETFSFDDPDGRVSRSEQRTTETALRLTPVIDEMTQANENLIDQHQRHGESQASLLRKLASQIEHNRHAIEDIEASFERDRY